MVSLKATEKVKDDACDVVTAMEMEMETVMAMEMEVMVTVME